MRPTIVPSSSMELDRFVDGVNANPHLTRLAVAASRLALDHFVDGMNANPHLTRLAVAAWGLALEITLLLERTLTHI
jgi:hypothetical protein